MFFDLIKELESEGNEIIITARPLANTIDLLNQKKLAFTVIGEHYGKNIFKKIAGYPIRIFQLANFLKNQQIDIAVSQSSFHSPIVAKLLGIPSIYTNDNEHAWGNKPSFYFATKILIPENLSIDKIIGWGISRNKVIQYPGVKEGIYLWSKSKEIYKNRLDMNHKKNNIYIRPEPQTAQYYKGKVNFLDETIINLQHDFNITILPRDNEQMIHYTNEKFKYCLVPEKPLSFESIASNCSVFIGAGGSMTREMAIIGIPTISVYQDKLLAVDQYIISKGLMTHDANINAKKIQNIIYNIEKRNPAQELMIKGEKAYILLKSEIVNLGKK